MIRSALAVLATLALALPAAAAELAASPATLAGVLAKARAGDVVRLAGGVYGPLWIGSRHYAEPLTLVAADRARPPVFPTVAVKHASGVVLDGLVVDFRPDTKTVSFSPAVVVEGAKKVTLRRLRVKGGMAVAGVREDATIGDRTGSIIGRPTGYGVQLVRSQDVTFEDSEVTGFDRQVVLGTLERARIAGNTLRDRRRTAIVGSDLQYVTIEMNTIENSRPWRWGLPNGDHADCIALWADPRTGRPNVGVRIVRNRMQQLAGPAIMGMWLDGKKAETAFLDAEIADNVIMIPNLQGVILWHVRDSRVVRNTLIRVDIPESPARQRPTILLRVGTDNVSVAENKVSAPISDQSGGKNPASKNTILKGAAPRS